MKELHHVVNDLQIYFQLQTVKWYIYKTYLFYLSLDDRINETFNELVKWVDVLDSKVGLLQNVLLTCPANHLLCGFDIGRKGLKTQVLLYVYYRVALS